MALNVSNDLLSVLKDEMQIVWPPFEKKVESFSDLDKNTIYTQLVLLYKESLLIKSRGGSTQKFTSLYYESGNYLIDEFLQAMWDSFKAWQKFSGQKLTQELYTHTNRNTDNWFPLVTIDSIVNSYNNGGNTVLVYRGCSLVEFQKNLHTERQSWSTDIDIAKTFAFRHPSNQYSLANRVVIKATVKCDDVLWNVGGVESELVLRLGFEPISCKVEVTCQQFKASQL